MMRRYNRQALGRLMKARGVDIPELARRTKASRRTAQYWRRGMVVPGADALGRLASALGVTTDAFYVERPKAHEQTQEGKR